jgi:Tfp pilus assembly protein FimT
MVVIALAGFLALLAVPNFIVSRTRSRTNLCINHLRLIADMKDRAAMELGLTESATPTVGQISPYFKVPLRNGLPVEPQGDVCSINAISVYPACGIGGDHVYGQPQAGRGSGGSRWIPGGRIIQKGGNVKLKCGLFTVVVCLLAGCASMAVRSNVERYPNAYQYQATNPKMVSVLRTVPGEPHEVIGEITGSTELEYASWETIADEMRKKAASIGGDAVIIQSEQVTFAGTQTTPGQINAHFQQHQPASASSVFSQTPNAANVNVNYVPPTTEQVWTKSSRGIVIRYKSDQIPRGLPAK